MSRACETWKGLGHGSHCHDSPIPCACRHHCSQAAGLIYSTFSAATVSSGAVNSAVSTTGLSSWVPPLAFPCSSSSLGSVPPPSGIQMCRSTQHPGAWCRGTCIELWVFLLVVDFRGDGKGASYPDTRLMSQYYFFLILDF